MARAMVGMLRAPVDARRCEPADDLLSALVAARDEGDRLTGDELTSTAFLLLVAGHETDGSGADRARRRGDPGRRRGGAGVHALLTHPDQLALLRERPDLLPAAIEELLRHDSPVHVTIPYVAAAPVHVGGVTIPAGDIDLPCVSAAGRDPAPFREPERLDLNRPDGGHVACGHGIHHCLGAPLARLEGRIAIGTLLARFPDVRPAAPPDALVRTPGLVMNGFAALPVMLGAPA